MKKTDDMTLEVAKSESTVAKTDVKQEILSLLNNVAHKKKVIE